MTLPPDPSDPFWQPPAPIPTAPPSSGGPDRARAVLLAVALVVAASLAAVGIRAVAGSTDATANPSSSGLVAAASPSPSPSPSPSASPSPPPSPSPSPSPTGQDLTVHALGETVSVAGRQTHVALRAERWDRPADRGRIYVAVQVRVTASVPDVPFDATYYQLRDGAGGLGTPIPNGRDPALAYGRLEAPGDVATGWVTFETSDEGPYRLTYILPLGSNGQLASIVVGFSTLSAPTPEPSPSTVPTPAPSRDPNPFPSGIPNWGYPTSRTSTFYSGYGATRPDADVTFVTGSWVQPRGTCSGSQTTAFSVWVGIDDNGLGNLEQLGTEIQCLRGSKTPIYGAWYEMFPEVSHRISMRALPGDRFTASVTNRGSQWVLAIANRTTGQKWSITRTRNAAAAQALWVAEAPSTEVSDPGSHVLPLTDFGSVTLTGASATVGGVKRTLGDPGWAHYRFDMVTSGGVAKTTTSALSGSGGTSFTVRWRHQ
ncbi:MAG TPA: G1 family glutamic endopeptidase [Candidatus Limnocylindrales bacterium]|nr:G1 family glutamic endopeptidase [Candidatus Limnocylindrales bacterium]